MNCGTKTCSRCGHTIMGNDHSWWDGNGYKCSTCGKTRHVYGFSLGNNKDVYAGGWTKASFELLYRMFILCDATMEYKIITEKPYPLIRIYGTMKMKPIEVFFLLRVACNDAGFKLLSTDDCIKFHDINFNSIKSMLLTSMSDWYEAGDSNVFANKLLDDGERAFYLQDLLQKTLK
jgi:hypothetical protein